MMAETRRASRRDADIYVPNGCKKASLAGQKVDKTPENHRQAPQHPFQPHFGSGEAIPPPSRCPTLPMMGILWSGQELEQIGGTS